jgi:putative transposase
VRRLTKHKIINSDQGSHFTNEEYVNLLKGNGIQISMDSKGRALDNIFVEQFFRSLKYELIYLNDFVDPRALRRGINKYMTFYNYDRPHQSLDYHAPAEYYQPQLQHQTA